MSNLVVEDTESKATITFVQLYGDDVSTPRCQTTEGLERMGPTDQADITADDWTTRNKNLSQQRTIK